MNAETKTAICNVEVFNQIFKTGGNMDLSNRDTDAAHFDEITEKAEAERELIDSRVSELWKDTDTLCRIIVENFDDIYDAVIYSLFEEKAVDKIITDALRIEVIADLGL